MNGVVIKRKCDGCEIIVDQYAFFSENQEGKITLEKWLEQCPACKHQLRKPTDDELRNVLLINVQVAQQQSQLMQTQLIIHQSIRKLTDTLGKDASARKCLD